jgi:putative membrane protein
MKLFKYLLRTLWVLLFVAIFMFARRNDDLVTLRFIPGLAWEAPLVLVVLSSFILGALLGILACLSRWVRQRREILRLRRELRGKGADVQTGT